ncbi:uncharacterized protein J7T54_002619 [Emericellopsis cladophorae]|uniref:Enoyl reductase (ER) domain-containing protein n=1 Tax=Emericellopsis cladophorae TaxID=2686198 RepID=A0A9P9XW83_9HYPO|nr:uncharacterized protein J7T54_002619 [Emericellopsis cladophorae]KAI6778977.1 hypothetical protein J7T54_002619 [Emericellopsis cladophorae]
MSQSDINTTTMRAWRFGRPGQLEHTLTLDANVPKPAASSLKPQELLVKVSECGLNPADYKLNEMGQVARVVLAYPKTAGMDFGGVVAAVGSQVDDIKVGSSVLGRASPLESPGGLSEYVVVDRSVVAEYAPRIRDPAGLPTAGLTAYQTIAPYVSAGSKIFINSGSGGVGTMCVQIGKILGCHVTTTCSTGKMDLCKELGADVVIDYKTSSVVEKLQGAGLKFDLIVDNVGNNPSNLFSASNDYLKPHAPYFFVGGNLSFSTVTSLLYATLAPAFMGGAKGSFRVFMTKNSQPDLEQLTAWLSDGKLKLIVDKRFSFEEAKSAMEYVKKDSPRGKVIVNVGANQ